MKMDMAMPVTTVPMMPMKTRQNSDYDIWAMPVTTVPTNTNEGQENGDEDSHRRYL